MRAACSATPPPVGLDSPPVGRYRAARTLNVPVATGLIVDAARMPVYFATQSAAIAAAWYPVLVASTGVVIGTLIGRRVLTRIPDQQFHRIVAVVLAVLGTAMILSALVP